MRNSVLEWNVSAALRNPTNRVKGAHVVSVSLSLSDMFDDAFSDECLHNGT